MIKSASQPDALLAWMDTLADPTRLRLLCLLERQELGVAELCDVIQAPQSTVSRHLKLLADAGWTRSRRSGTTNLHTMAVEELDTTAARLWQLARDQVRIGPTFSQDQLRLERLLRDRQSDTQKFFSSAVAKWDKVRDELYGRRFVDEALFALVPDDFVVADFGCGTGSVVERLVTRVAKVIGVDHTPAMLKAARKRTADYANVELREGDLTAVPIDDGTCDAVLISLVLTYVDEPAAVLSEAKRVLKPGGKVVVVDLLEHGRADFMRQMGQRCPGFSVGQMNKLMTGIGFEHARINTLPPEVNVKGPALMLATGVTG